MNNIDSISYYDKNNNLTKYVEFKNDSNTLKCYYEVNGNFLNRKFLQEYNEDKESDSNSFDFSKEVFSSVIEYSDNIMLFPLFFDGETYVRPIPSGNTFTTIESPQILNSVYSTQPISESSAQIENFTINSDLISDYLNKL